MMRILGLCGSLRSHSYNLALLRAAQALAADEVVLEVATLHGIPLYDGDLEQRQGLPAAVVALKDRAVARDGLLLATPEYNNGIPGVFKNAIDWLSRPAADIARVFGNWSVGIIGASPGGFGTMLAQSAWLPVLKTLGTRPWNGGRLLVSQAAQRFDGGGSLTDETLRTQLRGFLQGFGAFIRPADAVGPPG